MITQIIRSPIPVPLHMTSVHTGLGAVPNPPAVAQRDRNAYMLGLPDGLVAVSKWSVNVKSHWMCWHCKKVTRNRWSIIVPCVVTSTMTREEVTETARHWEYRCLKCMKPWIIKTKSSHEDRMRRLSYFWGATVVLAIINFVVQVIHYWAH